MRSPRSLNWRVRSNCSSVWLLWQLSPSPGAPWPRCPSCPSRSSGCEPSVISGLWWWFDDINSVLIVLMMTCPLQALFGRRNFLPQSHMIEWFAEHVCGKQPLSELCGNLFFVLCGFDEKNLNMVRMRRHMVRSHDLVTRSGHVVRSHDKITWLEHV